MQSAIRYASDEHLLSGHWCLKHMIQDGDDNMTDGVRAFQCHGYLKIRMHSTQSRLSTKVSTKKRRRPYVIRWRSITIPIPDKRAVSVFDSVAKSWRTLYDHSRNQVVVSIGLLMLGIGGVGD